MDALHQTLTVRLNTESRKAFIERAQRFGGHAYVLRELIAAFNEGRLVVYQPEETKESLYVARSKN